MCKRRSGDDIPGLGHSALGLELVLLHGRLDCEMAIGNGDLRAAVEELGGDVLVRVERVFRLHGDRVRAASGGWVDWEHRFELVLRGVVPRSVGWNGCH